MDTSMTGLILLVSFAAIVVWGAAYSASRVPPVTSRVKIAFSCVSIFGILIALLGLRWITGEEDLSGLSLLILPLAAIGMLVCLSSVVGTSIGIYRSKNRS
jgi:hypothetical protein